VAKALTKREKKLLLFVNEYMQEFNATKAAIAAGYSAKTAAQAGSRLLKDVKVKAMIAERTKGAIAKVDAAADAAIARHAVTTDKIIDALAQMGLAHQVVAKFLKVSTGGDLYYDFTGATPEELLAIQPMLQELVTESYAEGRGENKRDVIRAKIKFVERKGVLELLGRWNKLKLWADSIELLGSDDLIARINAGMRRQEAQ
jgi:phage terminase small subunit